MTFRIQQAGSEHLDQLAPLFDEYRQFYGQQADPERARGFIAARMAESSSLLFIATDQQGLGLGFAQIYPSFSSIAARPIFILNDLYVTQYARCVGVGKALLAQVKACARERGIAVIKLETATNNTRAQALYQAEGFVREQGFFSYHLDIQ
ncbi:GNAT family N-acetyltransferase [Shewanella sedimentimangrovi]|uniref:GNAT family N-acetyltransferase n=1 Tax=Shewanella sedimentimangrovi TaxID=2814293 RepID=A0ABX7QX66_9GAMM|nr:GNAT family N-acetyltransferase [Shewanella sedimentimangrovi]QSX35824.1 GNAT family N-acetyltransferase [Shewanella sedimentimangrovi]